MISAIVRNRAPILLGMVCIFLFGFIAYSRLPREAAPDVKIPFVTVTTPYPGVSPRDIETLVTIPLENELAGIKDIKTITSTSAEGISIINLEFDPDVIISDALQRARDRVNRALPEIPQDAEDTEVREISFSDIPILLVNIAGPVDETELKRYAEDLQDKIKRVPGVLDVQLTGGRTREFRIQVDPTRLAHYELGLNDVINAIGNENVNIPGGEVKARAANFLVRVPGEFDAAREIENVALPRRGDRPVFVRDVATVIDGFQDRSTYSRMNGEASVSLGILKRSGANIVEVAQGTKALVEKEAESWPGSVSYRFLSDQSRDVHLMVAELENSILLALLLVVAVVVFFMGIKNSLFVALAIPMSMLMAMLVFWVLGVTLNMVVLFALVLVLGMLVDNAIVLVENIYRHLELGKAPMEASIDGTKEVGGAVTASTLTTVAAFAPLLAWTGIMGEFMYYLPLTVVTVLLSSLVVAVVILPVLTAIGLNPRPPEAVVEGDPEALALERAQKNPIIRTYRYFLEWSLRHRVFTAFSMFALLIGTFMAYGELNHGTEFFPDVEPDRATITIRAPDGTDLEETDRIVREVEERLLAEPNIKTYVAETGVAMGDFSASNATNQARVSLDFFPHPSKAMPGESGRRESTRITLSRIRDSLDDIVGAEIKVEKERMGPPVGSPVSVEVSGKDYHEAGRLAAQIRRGLEQIPGITGLSDNYRVGRPELRFRVDRGAAKRIGASTGEIANTVRTAINGTKASTFRDGDDEYDITVELAPEFKDDLQSVLALRVYGREDTSPGTYSVPISTVADYELAGGTGAIHHKAQEPMVTINGDVEEGFNENAIRAAVIDYLGKLETPVGTSTRLGGADDEQRNAQEFLSTAFLVAIFLIALVLVGQFNRYDIPLIILASVVLSLIGVLWGLLFTKTAFGVVMTGLGVISLAGVVVNNAIVLLDYVEKLRAQGRERQAAIVEAGITRFRPVMLTAITTILGLIPMATGLGIDFTQMAVFTGTQSGEWWGPMAVAVVFGLVFATILTLIVVPTLYTLFDDFFRWRRRVAQWFRSGSSQVSAVAAVDAKPAPGATATEQMTANE